VRQTIGLPILRKDFISDSYQVFESAAWGADIILLIASVLDSFLMKDLYQQALESNLEVLIESHSREELETAAEYQDAVLGVNNRNLKTMETDLSIGHELAEFVPPGRMTVIESGIKTRAEVVQFWELGYKGFLIGKALMRSDSPGRLLHELAGR
jgi:indole-3-glycerol phosphate synthase